MNEATLSFAERRRLLAESRGRELQPEGRVKQSIAPPPVEYEDVVAESLASITGLQDDHSDAAQALEALFQAITIWEVYKRLLPSKPHNPYHPTRDFNVACPHEEGKRSLSMWLNDAKGFFTCGHTMEGGDKVMLYCEIRGIPYDRQNFFKYKRMMVWEFRKQNPYAIETEDV